MKVKSKFGIVVFLDALGARTTDVAVSKGYLSKVEKLKTEIISTKRAIQAVEEDDGVLIGGWSPRSLKFRFFGDSILITHEVASNEDILPSLFRVLFIICTFVCAALKLRILFRGALSIGDYLETKDVMLGPAITDAANWYDQADMIGVLLTPAAKNRVMAAYSLTSKSKHEAVEAPEPDSLLLYDVPLSRGDGNKSNVLRTYVADWPTSSHVGFTPKDKNDRLLWFYNRVKSLPVPLGTETKYSNTETFIKKSLEKAKSRKKLREKPRVNEPNETPPSTQVSP